MSPATRLHYRDYSGPMLPWLSAGCSRSHAWRHSQRVWHKWLGGPAKFSCWISLAVTQFLVPQASFTGHLCGVLAGLMHVYIPKAGMKPQCPLQIASTPVMVSNTLHVLVWLQLAYRKEIMPVICCCLAAGLLLLVGCKLHCFWRSCPLG